MKLKNLSEYPLCIDKLSVRSKEGDEGFRIVESYKIPVLEAEHHDRLSAAKDAVIQAVEAYIDAPLDEQADYYLPMREARDKYREVSKDEVTD